MPIELDHFFICSAPGAPEAEALVRFGLQEGPPSRHPGQGTANRRFSFKNAMIELIWVDDSQEAQSEATRRTLLWERWSGREGEACPFGICVRPAGSADEALPFPAWDYRPSYLPDPLAMYIGEGRLQEPMWIYMDFMRHERREQYFAGHPNGLAAISGLVLTSPAPFTSDVSRIVMSCGVLIRREGPRFLMEVEFDGGLRGQVADFRPQLPLVFKY
jgi:hypothetical protein